MKPLSESLEALAARVKVLEDSATATFEADRAKLEKRRNEIDETFTAEVGELESAVREAAEAGRTWWSETKASMKRPLDEVRDGPNEDADEHVRRLGGQWALDAPGVGTTVVYDPISVGAGMKDHLAAHPTGLIAVTSHLGDRFPHLVLGSGAADIVHASTAPALVIPTRTVEA
jgi:hypothetical protein